MKTTTTKKRTTRTAKKTTRRPAAKRTLGATANRAPKVMWAMKKYQIHSGTYNTSSWKLVAEYARKSNFIKKLKELGYEKYWGKLSATASRFEKHFGKYTITVL